MVEQVDWRVVTNGWEFLGAYAEIPLQDSFIWHGQYANDRLADELGVRRNALNLFSEGRSCQYLFLSPQTRDAVARIVSKPETRRQLGTELKTVDMWEQATRLSQDLPGTAQLRKLCNTELERCLAELRRLQSEVAVHDQLGMILERALEREARKIIGLRGVAGQDELEFLSAFYQPCCLSISQKEQLGFLQVLDAILSDPGLADIGPTPSSKELRCFLVENHLDAMTEMASLFGWLPVFLRHPAWDLDHYLRRAVDHLILDVAPRFRSDLRRKLRDLVATPERAETERKRLVRELKLVEDEIDVLDLAREAAAWRHESEFAISFLCHVTRDLMLEVQRRLGVTYEEFCCLTPHEVARWLVGREQVEAGSIDASACGYWYPNGAFEWIADPEEVGEFLARYVPKPHEASHDGPAAEPIPRFSGTGASAGIVCGTARVVTTLAAASRFQDSEILVARLSTVDFLPILRRAAAVVTEQGGMTSHAAAVAREMRIPALVGVSGITERIESGQTICVNANEGWVEILED